jgi:hypothetical protein
MNRDFLKAEVPEGYPESQIEVNWVGGKKAMMSLYTCAERNEDCFIEDVSLFEYQTRKEMHEMMAEKGIVLRKGQEWMLRIPTEEEAAEAADEAEGGAESEGAVEGEAKEATPEETVAPEL